MRTAPVVPTEFFGIDTIQDPYPMYARLRSAGAVHRVTGTPFHLVCSWDAVTEAVERTADFSSNLTATMTFTPEGAVVPFEMDRVGGPTQVLATADDPSHAGHRRLVVTRLAAKRLRELEPLIVATFDRLWADGHRYGHIEWMNGVANRLPMIVVARLIGAPDDDVDRLASWACASTQLLDGLVSAEELTASGEAAVRLAGHISDLLARAAAEPADTLLSDLAAERASGAIDEITAQVMLVTLFSAGGESTASLLGSAVWILTQRPDLQRRLRDEPALLGPFIEETLRFESPFRGHYRHVLADTELAGVPLARDDRLLLLWGSANRDPAHFEDPERFRLDRADAKGHISFGRGAHFCVGAGLARLEARLVLSMLLERTGWLDAAEVGPWLPSMLTRRLERLELSVG